MNMRMTGRRCVAALFSLAFVGQASAWWDMGHMEVAAKAYWLLDPAVRQKVDALIRLNPDYATWTAGVPDSEKPEVAFVHASTWADDIKRKNDYRSDPVTGPDANLNKGYADKNKHEYWHYIDIPFSTDGSKVTQPVNPNALTQIRLFTQTLSSNASDDIKSYDLVWLLHLVGDVHQPLHATARFSKNLDDDRGGNDEKVLVPGEAQPIALHLFWDRLPGAAGTPADAIATAKVLPETDRASAAVEDPSLWLIESFTIAQNNVYRPAILDGEGPFALDQAYVNQAQQIAGERVALAGARLAALLNGALK